MGVTSGCYEGDFREVLKSLKTGNTVTASNGSVYWLC